MDILVLAAIDDDLFKHYQKQALFLASDKVGYRTMSRRRFVHVTQGRHQAMAWGKWADRLLNKKKDDVAKTINIMSYHNQMDADHEGYVSKNLECVYQLTVGSGGTRTVLFIDDWRGGCGMDYLLEQYSPELIVFLVQEKMNDKDNLLGDDYEYVAKLIEDPNNRLVYEEVNYGPDGLSSVIKTAPRLEFFSQVEFKTSVLKNIGLRRES